MTMDYFFAMFL